MNKLKFLTAAFVLLTGIALTSCNTKSSDQPSNWAGIVRTNFDGSYTETTGIKLIPTNPSFASVGDMANIYCQINDPENTGGKTRSITLLADPVGIDADSYVIDTPGGSFDITSNAAIYTMSVNAGYYQLVPSFFDKNTLILPIAYFLKNDITNSDLASELDKHTFELVYYADSATSGDTEMKLCLRHTVTDPDKERSNQKTWGYNAYNIYEALNSFKMTTGRDKPSRIVIYVMESPVNDKLADAAEKTYRVEYNFNN